MLAATPSSTKIGTRENATLTSRIAAATAFTTITEVSASTSDTETTAVTKTKASAINPMISRIALMT